MFCPKCGTSNPDGTKSCASCQFALDSDPSANALAPGEVLYAGFWERFAALVVDNVLLSVTSWVLMIPLFFVIGIAAGVSGAKNMDGSTGALIAVVYVLPLLVSAAYFMLMEGGARGATFGKRLLKLRVVDTSGERIGKGRALWRWVAHILSAITLLIGYLIQPFTGKKQALHDMASGTTVVKTEKGSNTVAIVIALIAMFFFFIVIVGILAAVAIPAYQDYIVKAKTSGAVVTGQQATKAVEEYYTRTGRIPASLAETGATIALPAFVSGIVVNPENAVVQVTFKSDMPTSIANQSIVFTPSQEAHGRISWKCSSEEIRPNLLPQSCR